jgi:hypothetical protein
VAKQPSRKALLEARRFHLSWIVPALIPILLAIVTASSGLDMNALTALLVAGWLLSIVLLVVIASGWEMAGISKHVVG